MNGSTPIYSYMHNSIKFLLSIILLFSFGCEQKAEDPAASIQQESKNLPEDFKTFYDRFHSDSSFQIEHIQFPLQGVPEDRSMASDTFRFERSDWKLHQPFDSRGGSFERSFRVIGDKIVIEYIIYPPFQMVMERRFQKREDGWYLIYYKALGQREKVPDNLQ